MFYFGDLGVRKRGRLRKTWGVVDKDVNDLQLKASESVDCHFIVNGGK